MEQSSKSILQKEKPVQKQCQIQYLESENLSTTFSTGFTHNEKPVISSCPEIKEDDSIIDFVDTGFGTNNTITLECPKSEFKTPLFKENYLIEFGSETEKELIRFNLDVYSKKEVNNLISHIIVGDVNGDFVTKDEVNVMLGDYVSSFSQSYALYDIPNNLFPL